jgi:hypothetical protein
MGHVDASDTDGEFGDMTISSVSHDMRGLEYRMSMSKRRYYPVANKQAMQNHVKASIKHAWAINMQTAVCMQFVMG